MSSTKDGSAGTSPSDGDRSIPTPFPFTIEPYVDTYFLRTREILEREGRNPWVRAQVFIRHGPGRVGGIAEATDLITHFSRIREVGGRIFSLPEGADYSPLETVLLIEAPVLEIVALETVYLGVIAAETTRLNDGVSSVDLAQVEETVRRIVQLAGGRPVSYFGARHWRYQEDGAISCAAFRGGAVGASTGIGSASVGKTPQGTIPHILENIIAYGYGADRAVVEATRAFDRIIPPEVPRIALIDYANREIDDTRAVVSALGAKLFGVRIDTCGENVLQGGVATLEGAEASSWRAAGRPLLAPDDPALQYWIGRGVTVTGVYGVRAALKAMGREDLHIVLTSGFGDPAKVRAFVEAEKLLGTRLFDSLGVGGVYQPCRVATMDVVAVGDSLATLKALSKVGRRYRPNPRLVRTV